MLSWVLNMKVETRIILPIVVLSLLLCSSSPSLLGQALSLGTPSIAATVKGPNQINLTWPPISNPGYGYLVEIQSAKDARYSAWTEIQPIPSAGGYTCDN